MKRYWLLPAAVALLIVTPTVLESCGPYKAAAVFVMPDQPDSISGFLEGKLQVVQPTFNRRYLFVAYRYLSGKPLSPAETRNMKTALAPRSEEPPSQDEGRGITSLMNWEKARTRVPGTSHVAIEPEQSVTRFQYYLNCTDSAFDAATHTLGQRIRQFGAQSREVKLWLEGQDKVFFNCGAGPSIPEKLGGDVAPIVRADREYQIGAALFYAGNWDQAREQFKRVSADRASPWRKMAPYVAARALVRKATLQSGPNRPYDPEVLASAETELKAVLQNKDLTPVHNYARQILAFVEFRLHPQEERVLLDKELSQGKEPPQQLAQELTDYLRLPVPPKEARQDLSQWISHMSYLGAIRGGARRLQLQDAALQRWRESHGVPWLVAVMAGAESADPEIEEILRAARAVPESSPAYLTVRYHELRLLAGREDRAAAYAGVASLMQQMRSDLTVSSRNAFAALKLKAAPDLASFIANLPRHPAGETYDEGPEGCNPKRTSSYDRFCGEWFLDVGGAQMVNELPLAVLATVAGHKNIPGGLRAELLKAAWTKAVLVGDSDVATRVAPELAAVTPEARPFLQAYQAEADAKAKQQAAIFALLHLPGFVPQLSPGEKRETAVDHIDDLRENWWCGGGIRSDFWTAESAQWNQGSSSGKGPASTPDSSPAFLTREEREQARREGEKLKSIASGPNFLAGSVLDWAAENPEDKRLPEALHLAVRSTRFGCTDKDTLALSKAAFDLLHKRYPQDPWTKQTPYYFGER